MFNVVILEGRLTKEIELKKTQNDKIYCRFSIAADRGGKDKGVDFINCVAWNNTAEFINKYFTKGSPIGIEGTIRTGSYEKEGRKIYQTDIFVSRVQFPLTSKSKESTDSEIEETFGVAPTEEPQPNATLEINEDNLPFY